MKDSWVNRKQEPIPLDYFYQIPMKDLTKEIEYLESEIKGIDRRLGSLSLPLVRQVTIESRNILKSILSIVEKQNAVKERL